MDSILDFMGNPIFGVFIFLLLALIAVRQLIFRLAPKFFETAKRIESPWWRLGLFVAIGAVILAVAGLIHALSPSVRNDFAFLRSGVAEDNQAISNPGELCYKRMECYGVYTTRLRCAQAVDFDQCMQEKMAGKPGYGNGCGDFKVLYDDTKVSNGECLFRNTASMLIYAVSGFDREPGKQ